MNTGPASCASNPAKLGFSLLQNDCPCTNSGTYYNWQTCGCVSCATKIVGCITCDAPDATQSPALPVQHATALDPFCRHLHMQCELSDGRLPELRQQLRYLHHLRYHQPLPALFRKVCMCVRLCAERLNLRHLRHTHAELPVLQLEHHLHSCVSTSYALSGGACPLCSTVLSNCLTCTSASVCIACTSTSYALVSSNCVPCSTPLVGCVTCSSSTSCTTCNAAGHLPSQDQNVSVAQATPSLEPPAAPAALK